MNLQPVPERFPLASGTLLGQGAYQIERLLGHGGFALVYLAREGRWGFQVCIKEFYPPGCHRDSHGRVAYDPQLERRIRAGLQAFRDEATTLARFRHPGIVRVLGSFDENGTSYLVQELLQGMTFRDGLEQAGPMPQELVLQVAQQVGQALLMVHAAGLVHADLKPDNVFLTQEGRYVLLDFGLTRGFLSEDSAQMGGRGLSPGYSPPEQYLKGARLTPATDIYGFAATLYALLMGFPPPDAQARKLGHGVPALEGVDAKVEEALLQALALDPRQRTPGVREFLFHLGLDSTPKATQYRAAPFVLEKSVSTGWKGPLVTCLHPSGRILFVGERSGRLGAWSWPELQLLAEIEVPHGHLTALTVAPGGQVLAVGSASGEVRLLATDLSHPGVTLHQETSSVNSLSFHEHWVAAAFAHGKCCLLGPDQAHPLCWEAHKGSTYCVEFHPEGGWLVSSGKDGFIRLWESRDATLVREWKGHAKSVNSVHFSPDGSFLLSGSNDQSVKLWDLVTGLEVRDLRGFAAVVLDARFGLVERSVIGLAGDNVLRAFKLDSTGLLYSCDGGQERFRSLVVDPRLPLVATVAEDGRISLWSYGPPHP